MAMLQQIKNKIVAPTIPRHAEYYNATATTSTYYTLLDITEGKGILSKVICAADASSASTAELDIKVTIDGVLTTFSPTTNSIYGLSDMTYNEFSTDSCVFRWDGITNFYSSLKIEVQHTIGTNTKLSAYAQCSLE